MFWDLKPSLLLCSIVAATRSEAGMLHQHEQRMRAVLI